MAVAGEWPTSRRQPCLLAAGMPGLADRREGRAGPLLSIRLSIKRLPLSLTAMAVVILISAVAIALTLSGQGEPTDNGRSVNAPTSPANVPKVTVSGAPLPPLPHEGEDPAVGMPLPTLEGQALDGSPLRIGPSGSAMAIVVLTHWCPHCQGYVPVIRDWLQQHRPPGVRLTSVVTAIDAARPNYPPTAWLTREAWPLQSLVDDTQTTAFSALGAEGFPAWIFVKADGTVALRVIGELPTHELEAALANITTSPRS